MAGLAAIGPAARVSGDSGRAGLVTGGGIIRIMETEERVIDVDAGQRCCAECGEPFEFLGTEDSKQIDWQVKITRIVWRRRRYRHISNHFVTNICVRVQLQLLFQPFRAWLAESCAACWCSCASPLRWSQVWRLGPTS